MQKQGSLPWNRIRSAEFKPENGFTALLPELQKEHDARIAAEQQVAGDAWFDDLQLLPESLLPGADLSARGSAE